MIVFKFNVFPSDQLLVHVQPLVPLPYINFYQKLHPFTKKSNFQQYTEKSNPPTDNNTQPKTQYRPERNKSNYTRDATFGPPQQNEPPIDMGMCKREPDEINTTLAHPFGGWAWAGYFQPRDNTHTPLLDMFDLAPRLCKCGGGFEGDDAESGSRKFGYRSDRRN